MIKRKTIETVEEYDSNGKLTRKVTTETTEDDNNSNVTYPWAINPWTYPYVSYGDGTGSTKEYKITIGDAPGSCGSGSISGDLHNASNGVTTWKNEKTTPTL